MQSAREQAISALLAEMRERLENLKPETWRDDEAAILMFSRVIAVMTAEPAIPTVNIVRRAA